MKWQHFLFPVYFPNPVQITWLRAHLPLHVRTRHGIRGFETWRMCTKKTCSTSVPKYMHELQRIAALLLLSEMWRLTLQNFVPFPWEIIRGFLQSNTDLSLPFSLSWALIYGQMRLSAELCSFTHLFRWVNLLGLKNIFSFVEWWYDDENGYMRIYLCK